MLAVGAKLTEYAEKADGWAEKARNMGALTFPLSLSLLFRTAD